MPTGDPRPPTPVEVVVGDVTIRGEQVGSGPPVLLLHGIPETRRMWRHVLPRLVPRHTVVATDLRGYGATTGGADSSGDHSMRALAAEQLAVMRELGHERFAVVGHDRGARCAYRMAIDHPDAVTRLGVLDVVPTAEAFARADREFALGFWVWSMLASTVAEELVAGAPRALVDHMLDTWSDDATVFSEADRDHYTQTFRDPSRVHAICEQYRAAPVIDVEHDEADRGQHRLRCPVLALWSATGAVASWYEPLAVWREWADDVRGKPLDCGHFLPEEAPDAVADELLAFLAEGG